MYLQFSCCRVVLQRSCTDSSPTSLYRVSYYVTSSLGLGIVRCVDFCKSGGYEMMIYRDFNCISLIANKVEYIFMCVLTFCGFSVQSLPFNKIKAYLTYNSQTLKFTQFSGFCIFTELYIDHPPKKSHTHLQLLPITLPWQPPIFCLSLRICLF